MILPTPTTTTIEVCYIPKDIRSRYRAIWFKNTDFRAYQFNLTGHCTRSGCFVVDLVWPVSDLPPDLPTAASAGLVELIKDALKEKLHEVSIKRSVIDLLPSRSSSHGRQAPP